MNLNLASLFVRHPRQPLRAIVATRSESKAVARKREAVEAQLRRYVTEQTLVDAVRQALLPEADIERKGRGA